MPVTTVSLAKTTRPTMAMVLERPRLFDKLDRGPDNRGVWISGPPGSGKTTTIASYLQNRDLTSLWYQLDGSDGDVATFFFYLRQTVIKHSKDAEVDIPELPGGGDSWVNFGRRLFRAVFSRFRGVLCIVFDNYEAIPPQSELHEVFARLVEEVPGRSSVVFVSRTQPPPLFARLRANKLLHSIDGDDLRLSREECEQIARLRNTDISRGDLEEIHTSTAGWITGAILMLEYARRGTRPDQTRTGTQGNVLFDYLAMEIFAGFETAVRNFLLRVCWPRRLSIRLAEAISGETTTRQLLVNLARNNYFVTERDDASDREYMLHPLLREFLQEQARTTFDTGTITRIQRRTAECLIDEGQPEEAIELLAANLDWESLEPAIARHAALLIDQQRTTLLASWLEELPRDRLNSNPWLLYWYGRARQQEAPREARHHFELAYQRFDGPGEDQVQGRLRCCCGAISAILAEADDFSLLDYWIAELIALAAREELAARGAPDTDYEIMLLAALMVRQPDHPDVDTWFTAADRAMRRAGRPDDGGGTALWLVLALLLAGRLDAADDQIVTLGQGATSLTRGRDRCLLLLLSALHMVLCGEGEAARGAIETSRRLADETNLPFFLPLINACDCSAAITRLDTGAVDGLLERLAPHASTGNRLTRFLFHYLRSWRALLDEDHIGSHHDQRRALNCAVELGMPQLEVLARTAFAQLLFLCGDDRGGAAQLRRVHSIARDLRNPLLEFMTLLVYGEVALRGGKTASGVNALRYALGLGRKYGYYHLPWWHPKQLAEVCAMALQHDIEVDYVRDFIIRRGLQPGRPAMEIPEWPWPLRIRLLGGLTIERRAEDADSARSQGRPLQLLMILVAMGGREVSARSVAGAMWPHVDEDYALKSLTINLHRLRRMLGDDDAIILRDGRLSVDSRLAWLDVWALQQQVARIEACVNRPGRNTGAVELQRLTDGLVGIYRGPFLGDNDEQSCFLAARDHHRAEFVKGINLLAETARLLPAASGSGVEEIYLRGLAQDPCAESLYRRLMLHYRDRNRTEDAREAYQRCRTAMAGTPQQAPSAETRELYESLA